MTRTDTKKHILKGKGGLNAKGLDFRIVFAILWKLRILTMAVLVLINHCSYVDMMVSNNPNIMYGT